MPNSNAIRYSENEIYRSYGDFVSVAAKGKSLLKFGKNAIVGTAWTTIQEFQGSEINETFLTTNGITHVVSDDAGNTMSVDIEGHTIDANGLLTFSIQTVTLQGLTPVPLTTPLRDATRIAVKNGTFASPAVDMQASSNVYVYEGGAVTDGVPNTASETHLLMTADALKPNNQSFKASTSISNVDYAIVHTVYADVNKKTTASVDFRLEVRELGGVWRPKFERTLISTSVQEQTFLLQPHTIVPPNSDVRIVALSSVANTSITAGFNSYLAIIERTV